MARFLIVDVFTDEPLAGNALAVFPDGDVPEDLMQKVARETNLSETTFVSQWSPHRYELRIFTPSAEVPFAGHPTLGTAWALRHLGWLTGDTVVQRSPAGETEVRFDDDVVWLERDGTAGEDIADATEIARVLGVDPDAIGFDASAFCATARALRPAIASAGLEQVMVPVRDAATLASMRAPTDTSPFDGLYCFAPLGRGAIKARFFAAGFGVLEDPATGSAGAALGLYLGARVGEVAVEITQGVEVARPSKISVEAAPGRARVGGSVALVAAGELLL